MNFLIRIERAGFPEDSIFPADEADRRGFIITTL
jgi:hypothetical protein